MDIIEALEHHKIPYKKQSRPNEIWLCCPFCQESKFRLGVNIEQGLMHCFNDGCDTRSRNKERTFQMLGEALELGKLESAAYGAVKKEKKNGIVRLPEDFQQLKPNFEDYWVKKAYTYLRKRKVSPEQIQEHKIGFSTVGEYAYRIIFPVYYKGKLRGLVSRAILPKVEPKYKNSSGDKYLYNVPDEPKKNAILSEGVFDALAIERGVKNLNIDSLAVLGHSLTEKQLKQLKPYSEVHIWPDPDKAGIDGCITMGHQLISEGKRVWIVMPRMKFGSENYDPSEYFYDEIKKRVSLYSQEFSESVESKLKAWIGSRDE